eukprot:PhF_6_TR5160/c0_g1_i1/m.7386
MQNDSKTKLCKSWINRGSCPYGSRCLFAHGQEEVRGAPTSSSSTHNNNNSTTKTSSANKTPSSATTNPWNNNTTTTTTTSSAPITTASVNTHTTTNNTATLVPPFCVSDSKGNVLAVLRSLDPEVLAHLSETVPPVLTLAPAGVALMKKMGCGGGSRQSHQNASNGRMAGGEDDENSTINHCDYGGWTE